MVNQIQNYGHIYNFESSICKWPKILVVSYLCEKYLFVLLLSFLFFSLMDLQIIQNHNYNDFEKSFPPTHLIMVYQYEWVSSFNLYIEKTNTFYLLNKKIISLYRVNKRILSLNKKIISLEIGSYS